MLRPHVDKHTEDCLINGTGSRRTMADHEKAMLCYMGGWLSASIPHQTKASVVPLLLRMLPFFASTAMSDQDRRLTKQPIVDKQSAQRAAATTFSTLSLFARELRASSPTSFIIRLRWRQNTRVFLQRAESNENSTPSICGEGRETRSVASAQLTELVAGMPRRPNCRAKHPHFPYTCHG